MRLFPFLFFLLFQTACLFAQPISQYALLVGVGKYPKESKWPRLHADEDVKRLKSELLKKGYLEANIKTLVNEEAVYENIRLALKEISQKTTSPFIWEAIAKELQMFQVMNLMVWTRHLCPLMLSPATKPHITKGRLIFWTMKSAVGLHFWPIK
jgi:hypothetical protein